MNAAPRGVDNISRAVCPPRAIVQISLGWAWRPLASQAAAGKLSRLAGHMSAREQWLLRGRIALKEAAGM